MIQANELRIGNWVTDKSGTCTTKIHTDMEWEGWCGIRLTPDILKKAGFKDIGKDALGGWTKYVKESNVVCSDVIVSFGEAGKNLYVTHSNNGVAYCLYLHQFQNLYFALTGKELEIELSV